MEIQVNVICYDQNVLAPVGVALSQMGGALGAMDRPQKQADYARLSHPANARTVMAKTTVDQPQPLHPDSVGGSTGGVHNVLARQQYGGGLYGGAGRYY